MSKLLVRAFSISLDGYGAGANQSLANPLGENGESLHKWFFPTETFRRMRGQEGGTTDIDDDFALEHVDYGPTTRAPMRAVARVTGAAAVTALLDPPRLGQHASL